MNYSFFGTCFKDHKYAKNCILSILHQTIKPQEIVIIDSGNSRKFKEWFLKKTAEKKIIPIYSNEVLPRVVALNKAIKSSKSEYLIRFDSRSIFPTNYAFQCLEQLKKGYKIVGGVANADCDKNNFQGNLCRMVMNSSYTFGYPKYRNPYYEGFASSVYLGAFDGALLKQIKYRTNIKIISEDSLIAKDFTSKGFRPYISKKIKPKYKVRDNILSLIRLFNTYGFSRANSLLYTKELHAKKKFLILFTLFMAIIISLFIFPFQFTLSSIFIFIFTYNMVGELFFAKTRKANIFVCILSSLCQIFWVLGLLRGLILFNFSKFKSSNFIK